MLINRCFIAALHARARVAKQRRMSYDEPGGIANNHAAGNNIRSLFAPLPAAITSAYYNIY